MKLKLLLPIFALFFLSFAVTNNSYSEPRRVLLEFATGTWCQWCPCGDSAAEHILQAYPQSMVIAYHGPTGYDPFANFNGNSVLGLLGFNAYPTGIIDRGNAPSNPYITYDMWEGMVQQRYSSSPNTELNVAMISKSYNTSTKQLSVIVDVTAIQNLNGVYKISYVVTENGLVYAQTGNGTCPGNSNWIHNWVARSMVNGPAGITLHSGSWTQNQTVRDSLTTTLDAGWVADNCDFNVIVYKDSTVLNISRVQQTLIQYVTQPLGVSNNNKEIPSDYSLSQNYPNPFNPATHIKFALPKDGNVSLKVYDMLGNEVAVYVNGFMKAGTYNAEVDGSNWASGVYFYKLTTPEFTATKKMMLIK